MTNSLTFELKGRLNSPGFRPLIWKLVSRTKLGGWISDSASGAVLHLEGDADELENFIRGLPGQIPRFYHLLSVRLLERSYSSEIPEHRPFRLIGPSFSLEEVPPDRAPCCDCVRKMLDPGSRFYRYPFVSCSHCGPGFSIAQQAPFSRLTSAFRAFPPCRKCEDSENPLQVCPDCGPSAFLLDQNCEIISEPDPVARAAELIADGNIVSVKTFDGFLCLCDAFNPDSVRTLRVRAKRLFQPVTLMARDIAVVRKYVKAAPDELELLSDPSAPVVVMNVSPGTGLDWPLFCPDAPSLAEIMLPPTAMLRLLFERPGKNAHEMFAFISGPHPADPEKTGSDDDIAVNAGISDYLLIHDLRIQQTGKASVLRMDERRKPQVLRRSRGFNPCLPELDRPLKRVVLAFGSDADSAVALGIRKRVVISQQVGCINSESESKALYYAGEQLAMIYARVPEMLVCDMDPESWSARSALAVSERFRLPLVTVQRHHANALACLAEHHLSESNALILDGGGNAPDGTIWGAEVMMVNSSFYQRLASFAPVGMNHPRCRTLVPGFLLSRYMTAAGVPFGNDWLERLGLSHQAFDDWRNGAMYAETVESHAALTLLDAAAAVMGIAPKLKTYDLQTLFRFDVLLNRRADSENVRRLSGIFQYDRVEKDGILEIDWKPFFRNVSDFKRLADQPKEDLLAAFMNVFSSAAAEMFEYACSRNGIRSAVLSGKVFTCLSIEKSVSEALKKRGFKVYVHRRTSPGESSVCIGQTIVGGMA